MLSSTLTSQPSTKLADYLFEVTPLGKLYALPAVLKALAHDHLCEMMAPFVRTPDIFSGEGTLVDAWATSRPAQFAAAEQQWQRIAPAFANSKHQEHRRLLRLAACRRIDATVTGNEVFALHPAFAGFPYFVENSPELGFSLKVGQVTRGSYGTDAQKIGVPAQLQDDRIIAFVEKAILSFVPPHDAEDATATWDKFWKMWTDVRPLREFEAQNKLALFPQTLRAEIVFPEDACPPEYVERIMAADLAAAGVTREQAVRAGIMLYEAAPVSEFFSARPEMVNRVIDPKLARRHFARRIELERLAAA